MTELSKYKYKYDLHVHTSPVSPCGDFSPEEVVDKYIELGYHGIVLTNHCQPHLVDKFETGEDFISHFLSDFYRGKEYGDKKGFDVILGIEMRFPESNNDYLVYGIEECDIYEAIRYIHTDYETFYKNFKTENNLIIQAHPFRKGCSLEDTDNLDGIEVFNLHPGHNSVIGFAAKAAFDNPHLLKTGGTDFHHEAHEGMCSTIFSERITDSYMLANSLKAKDYILDIWGNKVIPY